MAFPIKTVALSVAGTFLVLAGGAAAYIELGVMNVSALNQDNAIMAAILHETSERSVAARISENPVPDGLLDKPELIKAGAQLYARNCAFCHSAPGREPGPQGKGENPRPPQGFFRAGRHVNTQEVFWYIKNGVKMTGMPSFVPTMDEQKMWSISAFLTKAPGMTPSDYAALSAATP